MPRRGLRAPFFPSAEEPEGADISIADFVRANADEDEPRLLARILEAPEVSAWVARRPDRRERIAAEVRRAFLALEPAPAETPVDRLARLEEDLAAERSARLALERRLADHEQRFAALEDLSNAISKILEE